MNDSDLTSMLDNFDKITGALAVPNRMSALHKSPVLNLFQEQNLRMEAAMQPFIALEATLGAMANSPAALGMQELSKTFTNAIEPFSANLAAMYDALAPLNALHNSIVNSPGMKAMQNFGETFNIVAESFATHLFTSFNTAQKHNTWHQFVDQVFEEIEVPSSSPKPEEITSATAFVKATIEEFIIPAYDAPTEHEKAYALASAANKIAKVLQTLSQRLEKGVAILVLPILSTILLKLLFAIFITPAYAPQTIPTNTQKQMLKERRAIVGQLVTAKDIRIVNVRNLLNVRYRANKKSSIIGKLPPFSIVQILAKTKRWSLVKYGVPNSEYGKTGWVYNKYLCKPR